MLRCIVHRPIELTQVVGQNHVESDAARTVLFARALAVVPALPRVGEFVKLRGALA